tara:strand:- start:11 stop:451 length:441 start_codon:yes stop_codon:yes gene_type:complete
MVKIEKVSSGVVRPLRHKVLRPYLPFETSIMPMDDLPDTAHFMVKKDGIILCVASMYHESFEAMPVKRAYRLRGMATEPAEQGKGYGVRVLNGAIQYLKKETDVEILWCNARVTTFGFYEKMGFTIVGKEFDIPNLGPHKTGYFKL